MKFLVLVFVLLATCAKPPKESIPIIPIPTPHQEEPVDAGAPVQEPEVIARVIGKYSTEFSITTKDARSKNIELAAERIQVEIQPGAEFSFNDAVGPRTRENGFADAPVIFMGETMEGIGGGVCQVSSTLHAAALMSALEVVSRKPHSRPSKYIRAGLDATVAFPPECKGDHRQNTINGKNKACDSVDLVLRNPDPFSVVVQTVVEDSTQGKKRLTVSILGTGPSVDSAEYSSVIGGGDDFEKKIRKISRIRPATYKRRVQPGQAGSHVTSIVRYLMLDGTKKEVRYRSEYPPVNEVWEVGLEYDLSGPPPWEN